MFWSCIGYMTQLKSVVDTAFPCDVFLDAMVNDAANEKVGEERNPEDGDGDIERGKVGAGYAGVEAPEGSDPEEKQRPALPWDQPEDSECEDGEADEESQVEDAPECEGDGFGKEKGEVFGPTFDHGGGGAVHASGECVWSVAKADGAAAAFDVVGEGDVFEDLAADGAMASDREVGFLLDEEELAVGCSEAVDRVVDFFGGVDRGQLGEDEGHERVLPEAG